MLINTLLITITVISFGYALYGLYLVVTADSRPDIIDKGTYHTMSGSFAFIIFAFATIIALFVL